VSGPAETCAAPRRAPRIVCECGDPACRLHLFALACVAWIGLCAVVTTVLGSAKCAAPAWVLFGFNSTVWVARCVRLGAAR